MLAAGVGPWSQPVFLVPAAGGTSVCIFPKPCVCVMCVSFASKPQAGAASKHGGLGLDKGIRQAGGLCWYSGDLQICVRVCDSRECHVCAFTSVLAGCECVCVCVCVSGVCAHLHYWLNLQTRQKPWVLGCTGLGCSGQAGGVSDWSCWR